MSKNYYERLGVEETADAQQIKRAYYTMVKKYPPERFPEEYKALRAAYDTLSDGNKRAEYDGIQSLPEDVAFLFEHADKLERAGRYDRSAEIYKQVLRWHPKLEQAMVALARSYESLGNNGKAISMWEQVCAQAPDDPKYAYELALGYDIRGWHKKATAQYRRALDLDGGSVDCWASLLRCRMPSHDMDELLNICEEGIHTLKEHDKESVLINAFAAAFSVVNDIDTESESDTESDAESNSEPKSESTKRYLSEVVRITRIDGGQDKDTADAMDILLETAIQTRSPVLVKYLQELASVLPRIDDSQKERLEEAILLADIESLQKHDFDAIFHDLFVALENGCDCLECRLELTAMECHLLTDLDVYRSQLIRLRKEYPRLFALHADFFYEILSARNTQKLLYSRMKFLSKKGISLSRFAEDEETDFFDLPQTVRRTEPKIGRNDPCPCGSGKKYKKCCGKTADDGEQETVEKVSQI
jgi:tetratricopeptide (TPR) repeat protein